MLYKLLLLIFLLLFNFVIPFNTFAAISSPLEKHKSPYENYFSKAHEYQRNDQFEKAIYLYKKAIAIKSDNYTSYNNMGYCLMKMKKYDEAIKNYKKALELNPNSILTHKNLGEVFLKTENINEAKLELNKLKQLNAKKEANQLLEKIELYELNRQE